MRYSGFSPAVHTCNHENELRRIALTRHKVTGPVNEVLSYSLYEELTEMSSAA